MELVDAVVVAVPDPAQAATKATIGSAAKRRVTVELRSILE
jgi:hypothetical protein